MEYKNPILKGFYPDPSICEFKGKYYLITSSFEYFPGIPIFESEDLINWTQIGHCLSRESQLDLKASRVSKGVFAPTIRSNSERLFVVFTNVTIGKNILIHTDNPHKEWSDPLYVGQWDGIDPSLYFDSNGKVYIQGNSYKSSETLGIYQAELDIQNGKLLSERKFICAGTGGKAPESPHVFKRKNYYYLVMAEGGTEYGHMVTIFRSKQIGGPFESCPNNPILTHRSLKSPIQCVGHADFIEDLTGNWWVFCLGIRVKGSHSYYHHMGRETFLAPLTWSEDDWPVINEGNLLALEMEGPLEQTQQLKSNDVVYNLKELEELPERLIFLRNPNKLNYQLDKKTGMELTGSPSTLSSTEAVTFIGIRHSEFNIRYSAQIEFNDINQLEFGITAFMSKDFHYTLGVNLRERKIRFSKKIGTIEYIVKEENLPDSESIELIIDSDETYYYFSCKIGSQIITFGKGECAFLASELTGTFTGVILGVYCYSNQQEKISVKRLSYQENLV